jgi:hypothetical protein
MTDICQKLQSVCDKITGNAPSNVFLGMKVPADPERDLDLIAIEGKLEIEQLIKIEFAARCVWEVICDRKDPFKRLDLRAINALHELKAAFDERDSQS